MTPTVLTIAVGESMFFGVLALLLGTVAISLVVGIRGELGRRECTKELGAVNEKLAKMQAPDVVRDQLEQVCKRSIEISAYEREQTAKLTRELREEREKTTKSVEKSQERLRDTRDLTLEITQNALAMARAELADARAQIVEERERAIRAVLEKYSGE